MAERGTSPKPSLVRSFLKDMLWKPVNGELSLKSHTLGLLSGISQSGGGVVKGGRLDGAADPLGRPPITSIAGQVLLQEIAVDPTILQLLPISPSLNRAVMCIIFGPIGRHKG